MKKYYIESESLELTKFMNKDAFFFILDIKGMEKEDFENDVERIAQKIFDCIEPKDNYFEEIEESQLGSFNVNLSINDSLYGNAVKYFLIEWKTLHCEDTDKEIIEIVDGLTVELIEKSLRELFEYYHE